MIARRLLVWGCAVLLLSGCVGPARTTGRYEGKATRTANDAISALQTAAIAVRTSARGSLLGPYLNVLLTGVESDYGSVQQTFDSIQPPDTDRADTLRDELDTILADGSDILGQLRILARRGDEKGLLDTAAGIPPVVAKLTRFVAAVRETT